MEALGLPLSLPFGSGNKRLQCHESKSKSQQGRRSHVRGLNETAGPQWDAGVALFEAVGVGVGP